MKIPTAAIVGPTATGKSEIAIEVAGALNGEIVSVDSMQVYRGMNIGTAKVEPHERYTADGKYIPHHMLDIVDPDVKYSEAVSSRKLPAIKDIYDRKLPILVGTGSL